MPAMKPKVREDLTVAELDGETVVYDEENNRLRHLNSTASLVFGFVRWRIDHQRALPRHRRRLRPRPDRGPAPSAGAAARVPQGRFPERSQGHEAVLSRPSWTRERGRDLHKWQLRS